MHDYKQRLRAFVNLERQPIKAEIPDPQADGKTAVFRLYDPIDSWGEMWGVSAKEFTAALDSLDDDVAEIRLHINSPGGDVFEGIAILNALRSYEARVVAVVDGLAASAASFIACGADETIMARNSELMIHDAWGLCVGNADDMRELADHLDRVSDNIASIYAEKAGTDTAVWRAAMAKESWYSAQEAVDAGLADRVDKKPAKTSNTFDLSVFTYPGREAAPEPVKAHTVPTPEPTATDDAPGTPPETVTTDDTDERDRLAQRARAWTLANT